MAYKNMFLIWQAKIRSITNDQTNVVCTGSS